MHYFTYIYYCTVTNLPLYVGMGHGDRAEYHLKTVRAGNETTNKHWTYKLRQLILNQTEPQVHLVGTHLTKHEAELLEAKLIDTYGRRDYDQDGILYNVCKSAHNWKTVKHREESKEIIRQKAIGRITSAVTKAKLSIAAKGKARDPSIFNKDWRIAQRQAHFGRKDPESAYKNKSAAQSGSNNPRAKIWNLRSIDGIILTVRSLRTWCKEHNVHESRLKQTKNKAEDDIYGWSSGWRLV
jgi:hypothetical protein